MAELKENCIEWLSGDGSAYCTFSQRKFINRTKLLAETHPDDVEIIKENPDGSIFAKMSLKAIHLTIYDPRGSSFKPGPKEVDSDD